MSSFLRRLSHAVLPNVPNAAGLPAPHVPRRATETYTKKVDDEADSDTDSLKSGSRASWELSEDGSDLASSQSGSDSDSSGRRSFSDDSTDSDDSDYGGDERRTRDRFDMMTRYLWSTADRQGWFRDADFDGLVSIR
jgi:hypothetical protein